MAIEDVETVEGGRADDVDGADGADGAADLPDAEDDGSSRVAVGEYSWEDFKEEYYYDENGEPPRTKSGEVIEFDASEYLGFDPRTTDGVLSSAGDEGAALGELVDERTVTVNPDLDEDAFFSTVEGHTTVVNRYDLEKAVPMPKKTHFREIDRYWVNKPHAFVVIFHSEKENEKKYYLIEPYLNSIESNLREFLQEKLKTAIKYSDDEVVVAGDERDRRRVIERETQRLLNRYDLYAGEIRSAAERERAEAVEAAEDEAPAAEPGMLDGFKARLGLGAGDAGDGRDAEEADGDAGDGTDGPPAEPSGLVARLKAMFGEDAGEEGAGELAGIEVRPEPVVIDEDSKVLTEYQVEKLLYVLNRDFVGFERIDGIKHDINVEDISCDGYNSPVFVYHGDYEQIITNVYHGEQELDEFVVKLAQRSGKGISKRQPQVDATLPDGSRSQLTLGREVSDHGTNYTIRQFKDVPHTPVDLINWNTFSLDAMAYLWLCIENNKNLIFAGGTASGKTTSLNAVSLFIPSKSKIVSIEDTREVELPQRNWIASVTRPSFSDDDKGDVDEFDLLEAALRQRPEYIVMGEIRGEEGRTLFQVMSTGHTSLTTFHADSVGEVIKRFTTDPINVSKTLFTALDLVSIQSQTRVQGRKVRREKTLTEINRYDAENDEINVQDVFQWQAETDEYLQMSNSTTLEKIKFDRGWNQEELEEELFKRKLVLSYLIEQQLNTYTQVAATLQAFINDPDTILTLIAEGELERSLEDLREMESVEIDIDPEKEEMVPRPDPTEEIRDEVQEVLQEGDELLEAYRDGEVPSVATALSGMRDADDVEVTAGESSGELDDWALEFDDEWTDAEAGDDEGLFAGGAPETPDETADDADAATGDAGGLFDDLDSGDGDLDGGDDGDEGREDDAMDDWALGFDDEPTEATDGGDVLGGAADDALDAAGDGDAATDGTDDGGDDWNVSFEFGAGDDEEDDE